MTQQFKTKCHCCGYYDFCCHFEKDNVDECDFCTRLIARFGLNVAKSKAKRLVAKEKLRKENHQSQQQATR